VYSIFVDWEVAIFKVVKSFESVCHVEGFGLFLAKGCDHIAALTPCKQKQPLKLWHTLIGQLFVLDRGCGRGASPS